MAIYTKISSKDILLIEKNYNLGKIIHFKGIKKGIENTNYLLKTKDKKFILTLFERRVHKKDLPFFMNLMDKLSKYKINCPKPQKNKRGSFLIKIKNKTASIVSFVEGKDKLKLNQENDKIFDRFYRYIFNSKHIIYNTYHKYNLLQLSL